MLLLKGAAAVIDAVAAAAARSTLAPKPLLVTHAEAWLEPLAAQLCRQRPASPPAFPPQPTSTRTHTDAAMSSIAARSAFRAAPRLRAAAPVRRWASTAASDSGSAERQAGKDALKTGAKRDPELYVRAWHLQYRCMQLETN